MVIDECTPGRLLKKKRAAVYSTDDDNKHIQGTEFKMASLGDEIMVFALSITVKLRLMGWAACINRLLDKHLLEDTDMHNVTVLYVKVMGL